MIHAGVSWGKLTGFEEGILRAVNKCLDRETAGAVAGAISLKNGSPEWGSLRKSSVYLRNW